MRPTVKTETLASAIPRMLRGGSWEYAEPFVRCANRDADGPGNLRALVGFRPVAAKYITRVLRGGYCTDDSRIVRCAQRCADDPNFPSVGNGFRPVAGVKEKA